MKLNDKQCNFIQNSKFAILATANENQPRACVVIVEKAYDEYVVFADCQMKQTNKNLMNNNKCFVSFYDEKLNNCIKCEGISTYKAAGTLFEEEKEKLAREGLSVKGVILVKVLNIFEGKEE